MLGVKKLFVVTICIWGMMPVAFSQVLGSGQEPPVEIQGPRSLPSKEIDRPVHSDQQVARRSFSGGIQIEIKGETHFRADIAALAKKMYRNYDVC